MYMGIIVTVVMMINVIAYTRNSIAEKLAFTLLDKTKLELSLRNDNKKSGDDNDEEGSVSDEGGDGNG